MRDNTNTPIRLVVAGFECTAWDYVSVDSQIDTAADGWSLTVWNDGSSVQAAIKGGAPVQLFYGSELILTGIVDSFSQAITLNGNGINLSGRDLAGQLIDCSAAIYSARKINLEQFIKDSVIGKVSPLAQLRIDLADPLESYLKYKISIEPGESIWDALVKLAASAGQFVWFTADGTLTIGDPFANPYVVQTPLVMMRSGTGNNILEAQYDEDVGDVFNTIKLIGQTAEAQHISAETQSDTPYTFPRLKIVSTGDIETQAEADAAINKMKHDNDLQAYSLKLVVDGWTVDGKVWQTGWQIKLQSDVLLRANAQWVVIGRTLKLSRTAGKTTELNLKRRGDWAQPLIYKDKTTPDKKAKKSRRKTAKDDGQTYDADGRGTYTGDGL